ncbi:uncharacterized protein [Drosophila virilis]|uniref:uncharacterized protein n=1 Tax=Drosophila virilis TaxID=7244 RepID=UPI0013962D0B|nr:uncharacterized protein LOC26531820 [Drosophila virilis]
MSEPPRGLPQTVRGYYLQVYGTTLVFIVFSVMMVHFIGQIRADPSERNNIPAAIFFVLAFISFCIYVNVMWLRRHFPYNWVACSAIALMLTLGNGFILIEQDEEDLLVVLEIISLMVVFLLLGSWLPSRFSALLYIGFVWLIVAVLTISILLIVWACSEDENDLPPYVVHGVLWICMCPLLMFQGQVINGLLWNLKPIFDIPICSVLLLINYLACYAYVDATQDIIFALQIASSSNKRVLSRGFANM